MDIRDLARRAVGEKAILDAAKELNDQTRAALLEAMGAGDRLMVGTLGSVTRTAPKPTYRVTDREAFTAWVAEHFPEAIVTTRTVVPAWEADAIKTGHTPDGEEIPGVQLVEGGSYLQVRPTAEARAAALGSLSRELEA